MLQQLASLATMHFFDNSFKFGIIRNAGNVTVSLFVF